MPRVLNSKPCPHSNSMQKSESTLEESNLLNRYSTKLKPSKLTFSNLYKPSPPDLTISNETMIVATMAKKDEETTTKATLAIMVEITATILVEKAKTIKIGDDIPMTRISPVSFMEGDTVPKSALLSRSKLANSSRPAEISRISNGTRTATTSPTSIASLSPTSLACLLAMFKLLIQVLDSGFCSQR